MKLKNLLKTILKKDSHYYEGKTLFQDDNHRDYVGGKWDEIGKLQFNFMKKMGLRPNHKFIDVGCGCLRGGVHFIEYLENYNYYGTEINKKLLDIGIQKELNNFQKLKIKEDNFIISKDFNFSFNLTHFDYGLALSVFTHLSQTNIRKCLNNISKMFVDGKFYGTFFIVEDEYKLTPYKQCNEIISYPNKDPYHYTLKEISTFAENSNFKFKLINDFIHPRNQKMVEFSKPKTFLA